MARRRDWDAASSAPAGPALVVPLWSTLLAIVLVGALWLRVGALDSVPLAPDEAARALEALAIWRGSAADYSAGPLLPNLLSLWFAMFTAADGPARAPSALAGWAICLTPLLLRGRLGAVPTLASCALLALSPVEVLASRTVHPAAIAILAEAALVGCWLLALEKRDGR